MTALDNTRAPKVLIERLKARNNKLLHRSDVSDDESDEFQDKIKSGSLLFEKIFGLLDWSDLLECRRVCRRWNSIISSDSLLWSKARVRIVTGGQSGDSSTHCHLQVPTLYQAYYAPNFHFEACDLRDEWIREFIHLRGPFLRELKLTNCLITLPAFQSIMTNCENLEHLDIEGVPRTLTACESIFPIPMQLRRFTRLKSLRLKAQEPTNEFQVHDYNLKPGFLQDLIEYAERLESVRLVNWSGRTVNYMVSILNQHSRYRKVEEFHALEIRPVVKSVDLIPLCVRTAHVNLKRLSISPLSASQKHDFGVMVIRGIFRNHRLTLEEANITNCPVTSAIFRLPMPKLRILIAIGTNISSTVLSAHLTPNLEKAIFHQNEDSPRGTFERLLSTYKVMCRLPSKLSLEKHIMTRLRELQEGVDKNGDKSKLGYYYKSPSPSPSSSSSSVIKGFDACTTFDMVTIVLFIMALICLFIFGLGILFRAYSPLIFLICVVLMFLWEAYDSLSFARSGAHKRTADTLDGYYF